MILQQNWKSHVCSADELLCIGCQFVKKLIIVNNPFNFRWVEYNIHVPLYHQETKSSAYSKIWIGNSPTLWLLITVLLTVP